MEKEKFYHLINPSTSFDAATMVQACRFLEQAEITACDMHHRGSNLVFTIKLVNEGLETKAIYKPRRGENPLFDFPDGTLYKREVAAFLVSQALEWHLVPPTVIRNGPYGIGSVQWFVNPRHRVDRDSSIETDPQVLKQVALFDYVVNNADRKAGHFFEGQDGHLWVVDHGLTFNAVPKLRTVLWDFAGQTVPDSLISGVVSLREKLKREPLRNVLGRLLESYEIEALEARLDRIIANPVFPYPQSHRSVPWPWY